MTLSLAIIKIGVFLIDANFKLELKPEEKSNNNEE
jgi:hypothetical protein